MRELSLPRAISRAVFQPSTSTSTRARARARTPPSFFCVLPPRAACAPEGLGSDARQLRDGSFICCCPCYTSQRPAASGDAKALQSNCKSFFLVFHPRLLPIETAPRTTVQYSIARRPIRKLPPGLELEALHSTRPLYNVNVQAGSTPPADPTETARVSRISYVPGAPSLLHFASSVVADPPEPQRPSRQYIASHLAAGWAAAEPVERQHALFCFSSPPRKRRLVHTDRGSRASYSSFFGMNVAVAY